MDKIIRCYLSHSIRGRNGLLATDEEINNNLNKAIEYGKQLRTVFLNIDFYIPAEHEDFVSKAFSKKFLSEKQILEVDCMIIDTCDFTIFYAPKYFFSRGMNVEKTHVINIKQPFILEHCNKLSNLTYIKINMILDKINKRKK